MGQAYITYKIINVKNKKNYRRIINEINKIQTVDTVSIDKDNNKLFLSSKEGMETKVEDIVKAINIYEKNATIEQEEQKETYRKVLYLKNLDCGQCALKIENLAKKFMNYEQILVDFATTRFIIETTDKELADDIVARTERVAHIIDPNIVVMDAVEKKQDRVEQVVTPNMTKITLIIFGAVLFLVALFFLHLLQKLAPSISDKVIEIVSKVLLLLSYVLIGHPVIIMFFKNIFHKRLFDENFLMTLASIGAIITDHIEEAVMVMLLYQIGEHLQTYAVNKSRKSISELLTLETETARLKINGEVTEVDIETIMPGDTIVVQLGEMIPLDGVVSNGKSILDTKSITGESKPVSCKVGDNVISGSINKGQVLEITVSKPYGDSMINKILDLVENASTKKAHAENFITKFARIYTPVVVILALILGHIVPIFHFFFFNSANIGFWELNKQYIYRAMTFLVISCPCAIVISVPLAFFAGIGLSSKRGILIKGSNYLEALSKVENVVFDKTGTLTKGEFTVRELCPAEDVTEEELLKTISYVEFYSTHPIGMSIVDYYGRDKIFPEVIADFLRVEGKGVRAVVNGSLTYAGNRRMIKELFPNIETLDKNGAVIYVIKDKKYLGAVVVGDILRDEAAPTVARLRKQGVNNLSMLTGDYKTAGEYTANQLGLDDVYTDLLPDKKVDILEQIMDKSKGTTLYVGDGINDAPVIATADVGVAMGGTGSDATIKLADVVIMSDNLEKLSEMMTVAKSTRVKVIENIVFALGVKFIILILALIPNFEIPLYVAIFGDVGVSIIAILNSMTLTRLFKKFDKKINK